MGRTFSVRFSFRAVSSGVPCNRTVTIPSLTPGAPIATLSARTGESSLYVTDLQGRVWTDFYAPGASSWSGWLALGTNRFPGSYITAVSTAPGATSLYTMGSDGQVWSKSFAAGATAWSGWYGLGNGRFGWN